MLCSAADPSGRRSRSGCSSSAREVVLSDPHRASPNSRSAWAPPRPSTRRRRTSRCVRGGRRLGPVAGDRVRRCARPHPARNGRRRAGGTHHRGGCLHRCRHVGSDDGHRQGLGFQFVVYYRVDDFHQTIKLLDEGTLDASALITDEIGLDDLPVRFGLKSDDRVQGAHPTQRRCGLNTHSRGRSIPARSRSQVRSVTPDPRSTCLRTHCVASVLGSVSTSSVAPGP